MLSGWISTELGYMNEQMNELYLWPGSCVAQASIKSQAYTAKNDFSYFAYPMDNSYMKKNILARRKLRIKFKQNEKPQIFLDIKQNLLFFLMMQEKNSTNSCFFLTSFNS